MRQSREQRGVVDVRIDAIDLALDAHIPARDHRNRLRAPLARSTSRDQPDAGPIAPTPSLPQMRLHLTDWASSFSTSTSSTPPQVQA